MLGLRDVMDDPQRSRAEWQRKKVVPGAATSYYDEIWVYGLPQICDPLAGHRVPPRVRQQDDLHRLSAAHRAEPALTAARCRTIAGRPLHAGHDRAAAATARR